MPPNGLNLVLDGFANLAVKQRRISRLQPLIEELSAVPVVEYRVRPVESCLPRRLCASTPTPAPLHPPRRL